MLKIYLQLSVVGYAFNLGTWLHREALSQNLPLLPPKGNMYLNGNF